MFGLPKIPWGLLGVAGGTDTRPTNSIADTDALTKLYAAIRAQNHTPNGRVARGFDQFGPQAAPPPPFGGTASPFAPPSASAAPIMPTNNTPSELDGAQWPAGPVGAPALSAHAIAPTTPMPAPRPSEAPQEAPMSFWQRNAAMMADPANPGSFIDPEAASRAQASGPDVINKLLNMFHQKDDA
jgi:hypothetical protein